MTGNLYNFTWLGRCTFNATDKLFGTFTYNDPTTTGKKIRSWEIKAYTFWIETCTGNFSKSIICMKKYPNSTGLCNIIENKKKKSSYKEIMIDDVLKIYPEFISDLHNTFILHLLADDI
jgi:hypothetical protein